MAYNPLVSKALAWTWVLFPAAAGVSDSGPPFVSSVLGAFSGVGVRPGAPSRRFPSSSAFSSSQTGAFLLPPVLLLYCGGLLLACGRATLYNSSVSHRSHSSLLLSRVLGELFCTGPGPFRRTLVYPTSRGTVFPPPVSQWERSHLAQTGLLWALIQSGSWTLLLCSLRMSPFYEVPSPQV